MANNFGKILESMAFHAMRQKELIDLVIRRASMQEDRILHVVNLFAGTHGNLGISRRKLTQLCKRELNRQRNRERRKSVNIIQ